MGWTYSSRWRSPSEVRDHILSPSYWGPAFTIVAHASTNIGRHLWVVAEYRERRCLGLWLINGHRRTEYGYKDMTEDMGPTVYDCPLSLLDLVPEPADGTYAKAWRTKVRAFHARRRQQWEPGDECVIHGKRYQVRGRSRTKRSWIVEGQDGQVYRASARHMERLTDVIAARLTQPPSTHGHA